MWIQKHQHGTKGEAEMTVVSNYRGIGRELHAESYFLPYITNNPQNCTGLP